MEMAAWRPMCASDLAAVKAVSDAVHGRYTERIEIYDERLALYPAGCHVLASGERIDGYLIAHPWVRGRSVPFDRAIGSLPAKADDFYLHDLALMPVARGTGASAAAVRLVRQMARGAGSATISLVAVNGAERFWARHGFEPVERRNDGGYGPDACPMRVWLGD